MNFFETFAQNGDKGERHEKLCVILPFALSAALSARGNAAGRACPPHCGKKENAAGRQRSLFDSAGRTYRLFS